MAGKEQVDPAVAAFFKEVVGEAFETIIKRLLSNSALTRIKINLDSAELLIFYDPGRSYQGYVYRLRVKDGILWKVSFNVHDKGDPSSSVSSLVSNDYSTTTVGKIIAAFAASYRVDWPTKPLG